VYSISGGTYVETQKLLASDKAKDDFFGYSVSISNDASILVVGAMREDTSLVGEFPPIFENGAVYVYSISGGTYVETQKLLASDRASNEFFGESVSISNDGSTMVVVAWFEDLSEDAGNGSVYVYSISGDGTYVETQKLLASDRADSDRFAQSASISNDASTIVVGAHLDDTSPTTNNGAVYVYSISGGTYVERQKLLASDRADSDLFGQSVSISNDGSILVVGAWREDTSPNSNNGAVYVYSISGGTYVETQKLLASDRADSDYFGQSVSISNDASTIVVGAYGEDTSPTTNNGAVYVYSISGDGTYVETQKLLASDRATDDLFGESVSISNDGSTIVVGAYLEDTSPNTANGAAYVYTRNQC